MEKIALIVDESLLMRKMISVALNASDDVLEKYSIIQAEDITEAINKIEDGLKPAMIITGIKRFNISLISKIREMSTCKDTPIIVLASKLDIKAVRDEELPSTTLSIEKPFKVRELHSGIQSLVH